MYRNQRRHFEPDTVRRKLIRAAMLASLLLIILLVLDRYGALPKVYDDENQGDSFPPRGDVRRVVSLAPSITELIFALHVDSLLVGVTKYCKYPPGADTLLEVGGFLDVNIEALIDIQPDLVVLLIEHEHVARRLRQLEIPYLIVNHQSVDGILESYQSVGKLLHAENVADSLQMAHREKINRARELTQNLRRPSVLLSIGHTDKPGSLEEVSAAGDEAYYTTLIEIAGGANVSPQRGIKFPIYTPEGIGALNPEVIIDLVAEDRNDSGRVFIMSQWFSLSGVRAVRERRVFVFSGARLVTPGPRFVTLIDDFMRALHPELYPED